MRAALNRKVSRRETESRPLNEYETMLANLEREERDTLAELLKQFAKLPHREMPSDNERVVKGQLWPLWRVLRHNVYVDANGTLYRGRSPKSLNSFSRSEVEAMAKTLKILVRRYSL